MKAAASAISLAVKALEMPRVTAVWLATRALGAVLLAQSVPMVADLRMRGDILLYAHYARQVQAGLLPYRDFALEYPPAVLPWLLLPAASDATYATLFVGSALVADGLVHRVLRTRERGRWIWALTPVALGPIVWARLDVFVAAFAVAFVISAERRHWVRAGAAVSVMGLLKLWPLALLLVLLPAVPSDARRRFLAGAGVTLAVGLLPLLAIGAGPGLLHVLRYHSDRGIEVEAVAAVPMHVATLFGHGPALQHAFGSFQFATADWLRAALSVALLAAMLATGLIARRLGPGDLAPSLMVAVVLVLLTSKVLSPQYFVWAAAAVALAIDRHPRPAQLGVVLVASLASAQLIFPYLFVQLLLAEPGAVLVAVTHGIAVLALTLAAIGPLLNSSPRGDGSDAAVELR